MARYARYMALILPKSVFIHAPKTGGSWVREALQRTELPIKEARHRYHVTELIPATPYCCKHSMLCNVSDEDRSGRISFAFVRHPLSLYQSWWSFKMRSGWNDVSPFESKCKSETFSGFLENVLTHFPGWAGSIFNQIEEDGIQTFGRQENLVEDLIGILKIAGEEFDPEVIRSTPPQNVSGQLEEWRTLAQYTPELKKAILDSEQETLERFGYGTDINEVIGSHITCGVATEESVIA